LTLEAANEEELADSGDAGGAAQTERHIPFTIKVAA